MVCTIRNKHYLLVILPKWTFEPKNHVLTLGIVKEAVINNTEPSIRQIGHQSCILLGTHNFGTQNAVPLLAFHSPF